jgi:hypothetical protein
MATTYDKINTQSNNETKSNYKYQSGENTEGKLKANQLELLKYIISVMESTKSV